MNRRDVEFLEVCRGVLAVLRSAYEQLREQESRWLVGWDEVEVLLNPNGPLLNGGSDGDNGQTGRKLVADHYGPRVPIGGGALSGKHLTHIDRIGAYAAREAAVRAVQGGAGECLVRVAWAPNVTIPLDVTWEMAGRGPRVEPAWFDHRAMRERYPTELDYAVLAAGAHFYDPELTWNGLQRTDVSASPNASRHGAVRRVLTSSWPPGLAGMTQGLRRR